MNDERIEYVMQKVSVIIPTKNSAKTLQKCLQSIQNQTYSNIEIIVVDNFSNDATVSIAKKYTKSVYSKGPERSAQRNFAAKKSSGTYLLILDSDMYLHKHVISQCVLALTPEHIGIYIPEKVKGTSFWSRVRDFERGFYNSTCIDAVRFVRKKDFNRVGGFDEQLNVAEDWDFDRRISAIGKMVEIKAYIFHDESSFVIRKYIGKKKSYFDGLQLYINKWKNDSIVSKQTGFWYRMVWVFIEKNKWKRMGRHPILTLAMLLLRSMVGFEYLTSKIINSSAR